MVDKEEHMRRLFEKYQSLKNKSGSLKTHSKFVYASSIVSLALTFIAIFAGSKMLSDLGVIATLGLATAGFVEGARSHIADTAAEQTAEEILNLKDEEME